MSIVCNTVCKKEEPAFAMQHMNKGGESKLLPECTLPLTGVACVKKL